MKKMLVGLLLIGSTFAFANNDSGFAGVKSTSSSVEVRCGISIGLDQNDCRFFKITKDIYDNELLESLANHKIFSKEEVKAITRKVFRPIINWPKESKFFYFSSKVGNELVISQLDGEGQYFGPLRVVTVPAAMVLTLGTGVLEAGYKIIRAPILLSINSLRARKLIRAKNKLKVNESVLETFVIAINKL